MKWLRRHLRPRMRTLLVVLLLLVAGAIVNVAVAWGCALWMPLTARDMQFDAVPNKEFDWGARWATTLDSLTPIWTLQTHVAPGLDVSGLQLCAPGHPGYFSPRGLNITCAGLPLRALKCIGYIERVPFAKDSQVQVWWEGGFAANGHLHPSLLRWGMPGPYPRPLPATPIWPGFTTNTLFYAAILWGGWGLFAAPFALRRRRRIKRGLCPKCAYPIGASAVCTECGNPRPIVTRTVGTTP